MASAGLLGESAEPVSVATVSVATVSVASEVTEAWSEAWSADWPGGRVVDGGGTAGVGVQMWLPVAFYLLVCVCGLAGNALVVVAVATRDRLSSSTSVYVLALALADGLFMLALPPLAAQRLMGRWALGDAACQITMALDGINQFTSAFLLSAMGLDRYAALTAPLRCWAWRGPKGAGLVAAALWLLSLALVMPVASRFSVRGGFCSPDMELVEGDGGLLFLTAAFALGFLLPLGVMATTCGALLALAWRRRRRQAAGTVVTETERAERQVGVMVAAVAGAFGLCWTPFYLVNFLSLLAPALVDKAFTRVFEAAVLMSYAWSCANPALYALLSPTLRGHFSSLLCPRMNGSADHMDSWTPLPDRTGPDLLLLLLGNGSADRNPNGTGPVAAEDTSTFPLITLLCVCVCVLGLTGNALVIYVILRYAKMKTVTNVYILNLAIADVLCLVSLPFMASQLALAHWPFGSALCRLVLTLDSLNQFTSTFCLCVMSADRYLAVVHPLRSARWRTPSVARRVSAGVWAASLVVNVPVMVFSGLMTRGDTHSCNVQWPEPQGVFNTAFIFYTFLLGFCLPLTAICLCYLLIVIKVRSSGMRVGSSRRRRAERKVTRMVSIVVAVFVLCWLPFYAFNVAAVTCSLSNRLKSTFELVVVLAYGNSCANPVLYAFLSDNFSRSFRNVLCVRRRGASGGLDDQERSDSRHDRTRMLNNVTVETHGGTLFNGDLQTSI
ncbi:uncharacterized protein LOC134077612 [Sardina pilchardus]|uniref:uncharacterized protein LOC134077612 n=1 Tax=Sardina pilchardus TaxID=27697 RepID=UPI002E0E2F5D